MEKPTCSVDTALRQAGMTIKEYFLNACELIEFHHGKDYLIANPNLVGQLVIAQTNDFNTTSVTAAIYTLSENIAEISASMDLVSVSLDHISQKVDRLARAVFPSETIGGADAVGGYVMSLSEAIMGNTGGLVSIAQSLETISEKLPCP